MGMGESRNNKWAFIASVLLAVVVVLMMGTFQYFVKGTLDGFVLLTLFIVVFIGGGVLFGYVLNRFIREKIRPIYQLVLRTKKVSSYDARNIDTLDREVKEWVEQSQRELADYKLKEAYRREFIGNVSHELKTPIFNIQGYVMTLLDGALYDENYNLKYLNRAMKSVERMIDLVEDLEVISQLETRGIKLDLEKFDLMALVKEVMEAMEFKAHKKQINLLCEENLGKVLVVRGDKKRIRQVMENLIVNAIKYGKEKGEVQVSFFDVEDHVLVEVADDGVGIEAGHLPRVFERFYRADKGRSREQGGSGLGLSIVKHIVEAHGHTVNVRSTPGEGSVFSFTIDKA